MEPITRSRMNSPRMGSHSSLPRKYVMVALTTEEPARFPEWLYKGSAWALPDLAMSSSHTRGLSVV